MFKLFTSKTYRRLERIYKYCQMFYEHTKEVNGLDTSYEIEFHSNLGDVCATATLLYNGDYKLSYANYAGSVVFTIFANDLDFDVKPLLNDNLTGHDVDLALLELENYLFETFGDIKKIIQAKEQEDLAKMKRHKEELRVLENGNG